MSAGVEVRPRAPQSSFLRQLRAAILADFEPDVVLCCKVAVLTAAGFKRSEMVRKLGEPPAAIQKAQERLKVAASRLDHGD